MKNDRELDSNEQALEILNRCANSLHVVTTSRIAGQLTAEILRPALNLLQKRHPRLSSRIVGSLNSLRFEDGAVSIPLRVVKKNYSFQWQEVVLEELNQKIASYQGLARAVLVRFECENNLNYLIITLHHAISDGLSSVQLHSEILTYCQKIACSEPISKVVSLPPIPPIQQLLPKPLQGWQGLISGVFSLLQLKFQQVWYRPETLGFEKYVPIDSRRSSMIHRQLGEKITERLVNCCRQEKTTVQAALCTAMMLVVAKKITDEKKLNVRLSCQSFVSLRQRLQPIIGNENLGMLASSIISYHTIGENSSFWNLARDVKQQIEASLECNDIFSIMLILRKIVEFSLAHPKEIPVSVALSNIGRVNIPQVYGSFKLEEINFASAAAVTGGALLATVSTFAGKMFLNFIFSEPSISQKTMEQMANNTVICLVDACNMIDNPN